MKPFLAFLLEVWREVSRHSEIAEFATTLTTMVTHRLPLTRLAIRRIDQERSRLETVTLVPASVSDEVPPDPTNWPAREIERLLRWCRRGELQRYRANSQSKHIGFAALLPFTEGEVIVGPLVSEHGTYGVLLLQISPAHRLTPEQEKLCEELLEPCSVALDNDHRLHELQALREAAEADKRFLLTRLGREELSAPIIGADRGLRFVMERVGLVTRSDVPVLLLGETGSGKEVIARAIHDRSPRLFDATPARKYRIRGKDAGAFMDYVMTRSHEQASGAACHVRNLVQRRRHAERRRHALQAGGRPLLADGCRGRTRRTVRRGQEEFADVEYVDDSASLAGMAVQGAKSAAVLKSFGFDGVENLKPYELKFFDFAGGEMMVARVGFTGDLGYEIWFKPDLVQGRRRRPSSTPRKSWAFRSPGTGSPRSSCAAWKAE